MKILHFLKLVFFFFWSLLPILSVAQEENLPFSDNNAVNSDFFTGKIIFASGCIMEKNPYSGKGAFTYGEKYVLVWYSENEGFLYSLYEGEFLIPSTISFNGYETLPHFTFESLGGMWSGLFFQDVFAFLNESNFEIIQQVNLNSLSKTAEKKTCKVKFENLENYIEWLEEDKGN